VIGKASTWQKKLLNCSNVEQKLIFCLRRS